jgi:hypothetical protein
MLFISCQCYLLGEKHSAPHPNSRCSKELGNASSSDFFSRKVDEKNYAAEKPGSRGAKQWLS